MLLLQEKGAPHDNPQARIQVDFDSLAAKHILPLDQDDVPRGFDLVRLPA